MSVSFLIKILSLHDRRGERSERGMEREKETRREEERVARKRSGFMRESF